MATTMFPTSAATTRSSTTTNWSSSTLRKLSLTRGAGVASVTDGTSAALSTIPIAAGGQATQWGANAITVFVQTGTTPEASSAAGTLIWISEPLNAVTIAGTITVNHRSLESNAMANYGAMAFVYKVAAGNGAAAKIGFAGNTTELGTAEAATSISITPTSTALTDGDMLAVILAYGAAGGAPAGGFTASGFYAGASGATGDSFVTFTEAITEQVPATSRPPSVIGQAVQRAASRCWGKLPNGIVVPRLWTPQEA